VKKFLQREAKWIGKVFGVQREKIPTQEKRGQEEVLAVPVSFQENQNNIEGVTLQASSPHLIDQNLMRSPILQEILQQSPALFIADGAAPLSTNTSGKVPTPFFIEMPAQEIAGEGIVQDDLIATDKQDTEPMAAIEKQADTLPLPALPKNLRTDPILNAVRKQALQGIFVLLGQEKTDNVTTTEHGSEE
jgi:hypothetical protein